MGLFSRFKEKIDSVKFSLVSSRRGINLARVYTVFFFFLLFYFIIAVRLFDLTVLSSFKDNKEDIGYADRSDVSFSRGNILDRNGKLIAVNLVTTSIYANPKVIEDPHDVAKRIVRIFPDLDKGQIESRLKSGKSFVWIKRNISPKEELMINNEGIPGVYFRFSKRRAYPQGALFAHIVGYVGLDGDGLLGAEKSFDKFLKTRNTNGTLQNLYLSLDIRAQSIMREELQKTIKEFSAKGAAGILQDVTNGEIIAMVSLPDYDPNNISEATEEQLFNKATLGTYEVGSAMKVFSVAAALDSGIVKTNDVYDISTPIKSSGFVIKDFYGKNGWLSVPEILMYSSNIGTAQIAIESGKETQFNSLKSLGLLSETEIEIPERASPIFRDVSRWSDITTMAASYGYGVSISPLHVTKAASAIANGGKLYPVTIVKNEKNNYSQVLKKSTSDSMRKILRMVVRKGSGRKADVKGMFVAGKSGTANKPVDGVYNDRLRVSSFISTFPAHNPKYAMYIIVDEPKPTKKTFGFATGGWVAAPVTGRIIDRLALIQNMIPNKEKHASIERSLFIHYNPKSTTS